MTHPDIIRYFMTIPEAARLVFKAAVIGESGQVMVLDMGEHVRIADLARQLILLSGQTLLKCGWRSRGYDPGRISLRGLLGKTESTVPTRVMALHIARLWEEAAVDDAGVEWVQELDSG